MKATELMIGDWVEVTQTECVADGGHYMTWSEYGKVIGITDSYIEVQVRDGEYNVDAHEDELKPIPITDEILKKNFPDCEDGYTIGWWDDDRGGYQVDFFCNGFSLEIKTIHHVHKLQHTLRLCGLEKEIEL